MTASTGGEDAINPFHDDISESRPQPEQPPSKQQSGDTLLVGRDASLTLGTDSLVVLDEGLSRLQSTSCCGLVLSKKSSPTRAYPYFNILWAELSDFELTIHHASPVDNRTPAVSVAFINYTISKDHLPAARAWVDDLLGRAYGPAQRRKRIKVLINPFGGAGAAAKRYLRDIEPVFAAARCTLDVERTGHSGHARELAAALDVEAWDAVACCSGDGLPHEVFNGLGSQAEARAALRKVAVVQLPCGTGNAMSWNLNGTDCPSLAALCVVKGVRTPLDLASVTQGERRTLSFLSQSVGIVAETDLGTENLRWMGDARFTYGFLVRLLGKTVYPCSMSVKVVDDSKASIKSRFQAQRRDEPEPVEPTTTTSSSMDPPGTAAHTGLPPLQHGDINSALPPSWPPLQPDPTLGNFYSGNMGYMSRSANFFPAAQPADGALDLVTIAGDLSRLSAVKSLVAVGNGTFFDMPHVRYRKVAAYRVVPHDWGAPSAARKGYISIDGESFPFAPFQVEVHHGLGTVLSTRGARGYETPDVI